MCCPVESECQVVDVARGQNIPDLATNFQARVAINTDGRSFGEDALVRTIPYPPIAGYPLASEMPRHKGRAMRNTRKPDNKSLSRNFLKPCRSPRGMSDSEEIPPED